MSAKNTGTCVRRGCAPVLIALVVAAAGCARPAVDVAAALRMADITTGWFDSGIVERIRNKLVPTISFRLDNVSAGQLRSLQINGVFRRAGDDQEWGNMYIRAVGSEGLEHGDSVDVTVELFVKHRSAQWVKVIEIDRQLLTD